MATPTLGQKANRMDVISNSENNKYWKDTTFREKIQYVTQRITIEPMVACVVMPSMLLMLGVQNLNLEKACRVNLSYNTTVCDALMRRDTADYEFEEKSVQKLVAKMIAWKSVVHSTVPCLIILFFGSWSDRNGRRKPCILVPLIGHWITAFCLLTCVYFEKSPIEYAIFVEVFFSSISGGGFTMMIGLFSYIADITTEKARTFRIGIISLVYSVSVPFGMAFSGILLRKIGYYGVFTMAGMFYTMALLYGFFILKEVPPKALKENTKPNNNNKKSLLRDFFDTKHIHETFRVAFQSNDKQRRKKIIMLMVIVIVVVGPQHGEVSLFYLFTRYQFNWTEVEFSFFSTYSMAVHLIGTLFSVSVLSKWLKIHDTIVGALSSLSKILSNMVYAFATVAWHMYFGPIAEIIGGTAFIAMRSFASKLVSSEELGKINSLFGIVESLAPLIYSPVLAAVYTATISYWPGAFFLVGGLMTIPGVLIFIWLYFIQKNDETNLDGNDNLKMGGQPPPPESTESNQTGDTVFNITIGDCSK